MPGEKQAASYKDRGHSRGGNAEETNSRGQKRQGTKMRGEVMGDCTCSSCDWRSLVSSSNVFMLSSSTAICKNKQKNPMASHYYSNVTLKEQL